MSQLIPAETVGAVAEHTNTNQDDATCQPQTLSIHRVMLTTESNISDENLISERHSFVSFVFVREAAFDAYMCSKQW